MNSPVHTSLSELGQTRSISNSVNQIYCNYHFPVELVKKKKSLRIRQWLRLWGCMVIFMQCFDYVNQLSELSHLDNYFRLANLRISVSYLHISQLFLQNMFSFMNHLRQTLACSVVCLYWEAQNYHPPQQYCY